VVQLWNGMVDWQNAVQLVEGFVSEPVAQAQPDHLRPHVTIQGARR